MIFFLAAGSFCPSLREAPGLLHLCVAATSPLSDTRQNLFSQGVLCAFCHSVSLSTFFFNQQDSAFALLYHSQLEKHFQNGWFVRTVVASNQQLAVPLQWADSRSEAPIKHAWPEQQSGFSPLSEVAGSNTCPHYSEESVLCAGLSMVFHGLPVSSKWYVLVKIGPGQPYLHMWRTLGHPFEATLEFSLSSMCKTSCWR